MAALRAAIILLLLNDVGGALGLNPNQGIY